MNAYIERICLPGIFHQLSRYPVVALLGPRQSGKSTLAVKVQEQIPKSIYLDLQDPSALRRMEDPIALFDQNEDSLIILDEIQRVPDFFPVLRSLVDKKRRNGRALILGSASRDLIKQSSETLAGRICFVEISPFQRKETSALCSWQTHWIRGGFPLSLLAKTNEDSLDWRNNYIQTFLERDIPQLGLTTLPAPHLRRLWQMLAHSQGQVLNQSVLARSLGVSTNSIRTCMFFLEQTFIVRQLQPWSANLKKRVVKTPKVYLRDSGILHALLSVENQDDLMGHPICGASFESFVIENILLQKPKWQAFFLRTSNGAEVDLLLVKGQKKMFFEIKLNSAPKISKGFYHLVETIKPDRAFVIAPIKESFTVKNILYISLEEFLYNPNLVAN